MELRKKQEEARLLFEKEKMRMRSETDLLASAAEEELRLEEEKAIAALRERRKERLKAVEAKRQEIRSQLEQTWIESQVKIREEHIEQQHVKLSLVSKAFGFFGKKRPSVRGCDLQRMKGTCGMWHPRAAACHIRRDTLMLQIHPTT